MAVFQSDVEVYDYIGEFISSVKDDPAIGPKIRQAGIIIRFVYREPQSQITIDARNPVPEGHFYTVYYGDSAVEPDLVMSMSADTAHSFWLGKVNLMAALTRGQIVAKGPVATALKLLPVIQPTYAMYPKFLKEHGREELVKFG